MSKKLNETPSSSVEGVLKNNGYRFSGEPGKTRRGDNYVNNAGDSYDIWYTEWSHQSGASGTGWRSLQQHLDTVSESKKLNEAQYTLSVDGLSSEDADTLSQILTLAGQAESPVGGALGTSIGSPMDADLGLGGMDDMSMDMDPGMDDMDDMGDEGIPGELGAEPIEESVEEAAKPDFLDLDGDGDKKEPMKAAADDKRQSTSRRNMGKGKPIDKDKLFGKKKAVTEYGGDEHMQDVESTAERMAELVEQGMDEDEAIMKAIEENEYLHIGFDKEAVIDAYQDTISETTDTVEEDDMAWLRKAAGIGSGAKSNHGIHEGEEGYQITPRSLIAREMRKLQDIAKD